MKEDINQPVTPNDRLQIVFQKLKQCTKQTREVDAGFEPLVPEGLRMLHIDPLNEYITDLVENAFIAGSLSVGGVQLNFSKEERAAEYLKLKGLRT